MDKFLVLFLGLLLLAAHGRVEYSQDDKLNILEELESWDVEDYNEVEDSAKAFWKSERGAKVLVNVDSFGAAGNGISDDTKVTIYSNFLQFFPYLFFKLSRLYNSDSTTHPLTG